MKHYIQHKKTKEKFVILGFFPEMPKGHCIIASLKNKKITNILLKELVKDYGYLDSK